MVGRVLLAAGLIVGLAGTLSAQMYRGPMQGRQPGMGMQGRQIDLQGTVEGAGRGTIIVLDDRNQRWQVSVPAAATVHVTGAIPASMLRSGLVVEFQTEIDNRGVAKAKVDELTVTTVRRDKLPGLYPAGDGGGFGGQAAAQPGPNNGGAANAGPNAKRAKKPATAAAKNAVAAGTYRVLGSLIVGRNGALSLHAGRTLVQFELADDPKIGIDASDFTFVRRGNKISVKGMANRMGVAMAQEVKVDLGDATGGAGAKKKDPKPQDPKQPDGGLPQPARDK
ncbi:MAG: hypothetical protein ABFC96_07290 [Thermoguttaceae bacterium]